MIEIEFFTRLTINKKSDFIPPIITETKEGRNPMKEIRIDLTLTFKMSKKRLNVNGLLMGLCSASPRIFFAFLETLFSAIEKQTIDRIQGKFPERYVHNGYQPKMRSLRTSLGSFRYHLAKAYDKQEERTVVPLRESGFLPRYRQYTKEIAEAGVGQVVHLSYRLSAKEVARIRRAEMLLA